MGEQANFGLVEVDSLSSLPFLRILVAAEFRSSRFIWQQTSNISKNKLLHILECQANFTYILEVTDLITKFKRLIQ